MKLLVPPASVVWTGPGDTQWPLLQPGDILLVRHHGIVPSLIRFFQRVRKPRGTTWAEWKLACRVNHACPVVNHITVSEAGPRGIVLTDLRTFKAAAVAVVRFAQPPTDANQIAQGVQFALDSVGSGYGYAQIVADAFNALSGLELSFGVGNRMVCSTQTCRVAERYGLIPDRSPAAVTPAHLAHYFGAVVPAL